MSSSRTLVVVRHAKAEAAPPGGDDHARDLSPRGRRDAAALGSWLRTHGVQARPGALLDRGAGRAHLAARRRAGCSWRRPSRTAPTCTSPSRAGCCRPCARSTPTSAASPWWATSRPSRCSPPRSPTTPATPTPSSLLGEGFATSGVALLEVDVPWDALAPMGARLTAFAVPR
nr:hypothetical protein [Angustibacter aerolatus]